MAKKKPTYSHKLKIKKGDTVEVIAGASRGTTGEVLRVIPAENRAVVDGANVRIKHQKASEQQEGGRIETAMPIHISNLALVDPNSGKRTRVGRRLEDGKLVRYAKASGETIAK